MTTDELRHGISGTTLDLAQDVVAQAPPGDPFGQLVFLLQDRLWRLWQ